MPGARAVRILLVANDGFSAGHVARTVAIARALVRRAEARGVGVQLVLATTSEAHTLIDGESFAIVRLPAPLAARRAGLSDVERRRLVRGALRGTCEAFGPDLVVADTFPSGPHGELVAIAGGSAKRALVRRAVRGGDEVLDGGLEDHDLAIVADDPTALDVELPIPIVRVPPITLSGETKDRVTARRELGLPLERRVLLVASGGGGDADAVARARRIGAAIARIEPEALVLRAAGPLEHGSEREEGVVRIAPLAPLLAAFDGAFAPAGYNTAHELAVAGVAAALYAQPRTYDDQAARAARFAELGLATVLATDDDDAIASALRWMERAPRPRIEAGGAERAADALLDLVTGSR